MILVVLFIARLLLLLVFLSDFLYHLFPTFASIVVFHLVARICSPSSHHTNIFLVSKIRCLCLFVQLYLCRMHSGPCRLTLKRISSVCVSPSLPLIPTIAFFRSGSQTSHATAPMFLSS